MSTTMPATGRLAHLGRLTIHRSVFARRFAAGCSTARCDASCCALGVLVDAGERDRVLADAGRVRGLMTPGQDPDPAHWFAREERHDRDFPSGRASHTRAGPDGCVFLDGERRCTLHRAGLKPFFCTVFPLTVAEGVLLVEEDAQGLTHRRCCAAAPGGPLTVFDVCPAELEHALGPEGTADLRRLAGGSE
jgi:Fe-S-cluster containining protein